MSWRTWVGVGKKEFADFNSEEYPSLPALADEIKWMLPAKLFTDNPQQTIELLKILERDFSMLPSEFSVIKIEDRSGFLNNPSWEEVEEYFQVKRAPRQEAE